MLQAFEGTPMDMRSTLDKIAASLEGTFAASLDARSDDPIDNGMVEGHVSLVDKAAFEERTYKPHDN